MCDPVGFVEDTFDAIGDVVEDVFDAVGDAVDWVIDEVIDPVMTTVSNVIEAALDDPVKTIAQIAAVATGNAWALPLIEGASVAADGGDLGDVLEATAKAYVAQQVGSYVGKTVGTAVSNAGTAAEYGVNAGSQQAAMLAAQEAGMQTASQIAGQIVGAGAASSAVAVVTGQDPVKAFITGGVGAAVPAVLGQVPGFTKLPPSAQQVIKQAVATQLAGGNVTTAVIGSAIQASGIVTDIINKFDPDGTKMTPAQRAIATDVLMGSTTAALSGGNVSAAVQSALMKNGSKALGDMLTDKFKSTVDGVTTKYDAAEKAAAKVDANIAAQEKTATEYNKVVNELNGRVAEQDKLKAAYDTAAAAQKANPNQATTDAANAAAKKYNDYVSKLNTDYANTYKPQIDKYAKELATIQKEYGNLEEVYSNAIKNVGAVTDAVKAELGTTIDTSNKAFVKALDPSFNADQYRKINGLGAGVDVYDHWLSKGQFEGLKTNNTAAQADFTAQKVRLIDELANAKGISLSQISDVDAKNFFTNVDSKYGGNLNALKGASIQDFLTGNTRSYDDLLKDSKSDGFKVEINGQAYGAWNKNQLGGYTPPAGTRLATQDEFENNTAVLTYTNDGKPVWVSQDNTTPVMMWDSKKGDYVPLPTEIVATGKRLSDLQANDPEAWLVMAGSIPGDGKGGIDDFLYNFAKSTMELAKTTGNSTIINGAGNALKAGGGILQAFNGLVTLAGINPNNTAVGKFAEKLTNLGKATTTAEYQAAVADINKTIGEAKGVMGTAKAIWGAATKYPAEFLAEIVGVEGMQEVVPLLIGGGASTATKGLALARGMGTRLAAEWGAKAGITAAAAAGIAESTGGAAQSAFTEAYNVARSKGMSEADATKTALEIASRTGLTAGVITATTLGIGGAALEKAILGKAGTGELASVIDALGKRVKEGGTITIKEGVVEGIEEGLTQGYLEGQLYQLDPTRDISGNITSSSILGAIAGGGVSGGAYGAAKTGDVVSNLLMSSNPTVASTVQNSANAAAATTALNNLGITDAKLQANLLDTKYDSAYTSAAEARAALSDRTDFAASEADINALVGETSDVNLAGAVEKYVDPRVVDIAEVQAAAKAEGYTLSDAEAAKLVGQKDEAAAIAAARAQFDPLATTSDEAKQFFTSQGYTPSAAEINQFVASKAESAQTKAVADYVNPRQVTETEARKYLTDLGYKPTDADVKKFVGQVNEAEQAKNISAYVDPRMVDEGEVKAAYEALGLKKPTTADVQKLVGQYSETDLAGKAQTNLDSARYNSIMAQLDGLTTGASQETLDAIALVKKDLNSQVTALGGDVAALSGDLAQTEKDILAQVAKNEAAGMSRDAALQKAIGDVAATQKTDTATLTSKLAGVQSTLGKEIAGVQTALAQTEKDILAQVAKNEAAGMSRDAALQKAIGDVAATQKTDTATLTSKLAGVQSALGQEISTKVSNLQAELSAEIDAAIAAGAQGDAALQKGIDSLSAKMGVNQSALLAQLGTTTTAIKTDFATKLAGLDTKLSTAIADAKAAGLQGDAALKAAIDKVAADQNTSSSALLNKLGTTEAALSKQFNTQIVGLDSKLSAAIADAKAAGLAGDAALRAAIDKVAADQGTTAASLLAKLGTTEANLKSQFGMQISGLDAKLSAAIADAKAAGLAGDAALKAAIDTVAANEKTNAASLLAKLGTTEAALKSQFASQISGVQAQIGNVQSALTKAIADAQAAGLKGDAALQAAIDTVAGDLGTTKADLLTKLGTTEANLRAEFAAQIGGVQTQLTDVQKSITDQMAAYEKLGLARDDALSLAIGTVAGNLGTTKSDLLARLGTTEANLAAQITGVSADVQTKFDSLTEQQKALALQLQQQGIDLNTAITQAQQQTQQQITDVQTDVQTKFDTLTQGQKDLAKQLTDQGFDLNTAIGLARQEAQQGFTDVFGTLATNQAATQKAIADAAAATQAKAAAEAEATRQAQAQAALKTQRLGNLNTMMQMLGQAGDVGGQQVTVKAADPAKIGYIYDWSSIFANPSQQQMFVTPYAQGGAVRSEMDDVNDELLKFLRG